MSAAHPGKVELVDEERGTREVMDVKDVPASVAFSNGAPVVRVVHSKRGTEHIVRSYGVDGALLSSTVAR
jgi:hypothetical protein